MPDLRCALVFDKIRTLKPVLMDSVYCNGEILQFVTNASKNRSIQLHGLGDIAMKLWRGNLRRTGIQSHSGGQAITDLVS